MKAPPSSVMLFSLAQQRLTKASLISMISWILTLIVIRSPSTHVLRFICALIFCPYNQLYVSFTLCINQFCVSFSSCYLSHTIEVFLRLQTPKKFNHLFWEDTRVRNFDFMFDVTGHKVGDIYGLVHCCPSPSLNSTAV